MRSAAGLDERLATQSNWKSATKVRNYLFFTPPEGKIGRMGADLWAAYYGRGPSIGELFYLDFFGRRARQIRAEIWYKRTRYDRPPRGDVSTSKKGKELAYREQAQGRGRKGPTVGRHHDLLWVASTTYRRSQRRSTVGSFWRPSKVGLQSNKSDASGSGEQPLRN